MSNLRATDDIWGLGDGDGDRFRKIIKMDAEWRVSVHKDATREELMKAVKFLLHTYVAQVFKARWRRGIPTEMGHYWQRVPMDRQPSDIEPSIICVMDSTRTHYQMLGAEHVMDFTSEDEKYEYARIPDPEGMP